MRKNYLSAVFLCCCTLSAYAQRTWTLEECIDYAVKHNITLQKAQANVETDEINIKEQRGSLLPTVSASVQQGLIWRPISESASNIVNGSIASSSSNKANYSGSYGVNAQWTIWNGGRRMMNIENATLARDMALLQAESSANSITEQIVQYYVQILYMKEALKVNEQLLEHDRTIYNRGRDMVEQGQMSRSQLAQLEAQVANGEYDVVNTRTMIAEQTLELKQLLELEPEDELTVATATVDDDAALRLIPDKDEVYDYALAQRPEIKSGEKQLQQSRNSTRLAKAQRLPSLSLGAGLNDSHMSGGTGAGTQLKNNFSGQLSLGVSIPIFDQRQTSSAIQRAKVNERIAELDLADARETLWQTIEKYWLNACNNQQKFLSSRTNVKSMSTTYNLLDEQFRLGVTDIANLLQGRDNLLRAQQTLLQDKYTTVLNLLLLDFYQGKSIKL